jgi:flagellar capping protein FliD
MAIDNLNSLTVNSSGKAVFSGLGSGIDFQKVVEDLIKAKRIPIDTIEARITKNSDKLTALDTLRSHLSSVLNSLSSLRGAVSVGNTNNAFAATQVFATTSRTDGSTPSAAGNLVGASTTNAAAIGSHTIEVLRVATAHKVTSQTYASKTAALSQTGSFEVTGSGGKATITVQAADSLQDIRDRINNANSGTNGTKVTASIVQASSTQFVLVLTADKTGSEITVTEGSGGTVLSGLGISTTQGTGGYRNGLLDATSKIDATSDGFAKILFDGTQADNTFLISYDQATKVVTLTRGDGATDTATLSDTAIATGSTETATFSAFGATLVLDQNFNKSLDILVAADTSSVTLGTGMITDSTIQITDSTGDISGISSTTLTFGDLGTPAAISVTVGAFSGTFDGTTIGAKSVTLSDGSGNTLVVDFTVDVAFDGNETAASIDLQELRNLVVASGDRFSNQIQAPQTARFTADGLIDPDRFESKFIANADSSLTTAGGSFNINVGGNTVLVNYVNGDTLNTLVTKINDAITLAGGGNAVFDAGTAASVFADGSGSRLVITNASGATISLTDSNGLMSSLGVDNNLVIERSSNTISDLFTGITLSLFQGEEGTTIKLDVDRDLSTAKTKIEGFVAAYNELKKYLNEQAFVDPATGQVTDDTGVLFGSPTLVGVNTRLAASFAKLTEGINESFSVLRQIGITIVDKKDVIDPFEANTLKIDDTILDEALLNNAEDIRRLFAFDFKSSDPRVSLVGFNGQTSYSASGYTVNINFDDRYQSQTFTNSGAITKVEATTGGAAANGISNIDFGNEVASGGAYRYSYNSATEDFTLRNLTTGFSETVNITALLDAVVTPAGTDLGAGQTATVSFASLDTTFTLSGDSGFLRGTDIAGGTLDTAVLDASTIALTGGAVTLPTSGLDAATVDALVAAGAYNPATGLLTLGVTSSGSGEAHFDLAAGISFRVDSGAVLTDITGVDLDDSGPHTVDFYVNDGVGDVLVASLSLASLVSSGGGAGSLNIDLGTGLVGETSTIGSQTAPLENFLAVTDGSFEIRDNANVLLGTVNYLAGENLQDLVSTISALPNINASVIASGSTYKLEILHDNREELTFTADTGGLIAALNMAQAGDGIFSANINGSSSGAADGSATVSGRTVTATNLTTAQGLRVFYSGSGDLASVQTDFTVGLASRLYYSVDDMLKAQSGLIDSNVNTITKQNEQNQKRVDDMELRLERTRQLLLTQFINMETALARSQNKN